MEMVAAAKLKRLQGLLAESDRYGDELKRILTNLLNGQTISHPLLQKKENAERLLVFFIASDTGLCGSYNTNMTIRADQLIEETKHQSVRFISLGRNGAAYLKRAKQNVVKEFAIPRPQQIEEIIQTLAQAATTAFIQNETDEVVFLYTKVESLSALKPTAVRLLPLVAPGKIEEMAAFTYILEPGLDSILERLLPEFIESEVGKFVKHALVAEQASRMMAMRQATDNAEEMIDSLTLARNKARQASITKELIEVVSGSRALQTK